MWSWDWTNPFSLPGLVWGIVTAVIMPAAAIILAVWVGNRQVRTAFSNHVETIEREERRSADERIAVGIEEALAAMGDLVQAAYTPNVVKAAAHRIRSAQRLPRIRTRIAAIPELWDWILMELKIVGSALDNTDELHLPVDGEKIVWRSGRYMDALTNWALETVDEEWFASANRVGHDPIEQTTEPGADDDGP